MWHNIDVGYHRLSRELEMADFDSMKPGGVVYCNFGALEVDARGRIFVSKHMLRSTGEIELILTAEGNFHGHVLALHAFRCHPLTSPSKDSVWITSIERNGERFDRWQDAFMETTLAEMQVGDMHWVEMRSLNMTKTARTCQGDALVYDTEQPRTAKIRRTTSGYQVFLNGKWEDFTKS